MALRRGRAEPGVWGVPAVGGKHGREDAEAEPAPEPKSRRLDLQRQCLAELKAALAWRAMWEEENTLLLRAELCKIPADLTLDEALAVVLPPDHRYFRHPSLRARVRRVFDELPAFPELSDEEAKAEAEVDLPALASLPLTSRTEVQLRAELHDKQRTAHAWWATLRHTQAALAKLSGAEFERARATRYLPVLHRLADLDAELRVLSEQLLRRFQRHTPRHWSRLEQIELAFWHLAERAQARQSHDDETLAADTTALFALMMQSSSRLTARAEYLSRQLEPMRAERQALVGSVAQLAAKRENARIALTDPHAALFTPAVVDVVALPSFQADRVVGALFQLNQWLLAQCQVAEQLDEVMPDKRRPAGRPDELWLNMEHLAKVADAFDRKQNEEAYQHTCQKFVGVVRRIKPLLDQACDALAAQFRSLPSPSVGSHLQFERLMRKVERAEARFRHRLEHLPDALPYSAATGLPEALQQLTMDLGAYKTRQIAIRNFLRDLQPGPKPPPELPDELVVDDRFDEAQQRVQALMQWKEKAATGIRQLVDQLATPGLDESVTSVMRRDIAALEHELQTTEEMLQEEQKTLSIIRSARYNLHRGRRVKFSVA